MNTDVDELFRQAFKPFNEMTPPHNSWDRIVVRLRANPHRHVGGWLKGLTCTLSLRRLISWGQGVNTYYAISSSRPFCSGPEGRCYPSPFLGMMVKQVLDLRLAS